MKIAIIYSTLDSSTKDSCKILSKKLNADVQLIPIEMAKSECILKYNFIILASSAIKGKVQGAIKRYISINFKTLKEKPKGLIINCEDDVNINEVLNKTFSEEIVKSSLVSSNFGFEINQNKNFIDKIKINKLIKEYKKNGKNLPNLNLKEIDNYADYINNMIAKRVD